MPPFMMEIGTTFASRGDLKMARLQFTEMELSLAMELWPRGQKFQAEELGSWHKSKIRLGVVLLMIKRLRGSWLRFIFLIKCFLRRRFLKWRKPAHNAYARGTSYPGMSLDLEYMEMFKRCLRHSVRCFSDFLLHVKLSRRRWTHAFVLFN